VLVINDKNVVERRAVKTSLQIGDAMVVEAGIKPEDWVITEGLLQAIPGREVNPQRSTMPAPSEADSAGG
jgi:membrane fusion protein, multidrug efflux system